MTAIENRFILPVRRIPTLARRCTCRQWHGCQAQVFLDRLEQHARGRQHDLGLLVH